jgi:hypothetical protein
VYLLAAFQLLWRLVRLQAVAELEATPLQIGAGDRTHDDDGNPVHYGGFGDELATPWSYLG